MFCGNCGAMMNPGEKFCPKCGTPSGNNNDNSNKKSNNIVTCKYCGAKFTSDHTNCPKCDAPTDNQSKNMGNNQNSGEQQFYNNSSNRAQQPYYSQPTYSNGMYMDENNLPDKYRPIGMWGYFGYSLLFMIPIVGFIVILVFSFGGTQNINVRNFARSQFCMWIIIISLAIILSLAGIGILSSLGR